MKDVEDSSISIILSLPFPLKSCLNSGFYAEGILSWKTSSLSDPVFKGLQFRGHGLVWSPHMKIMYAVGQTAHEHNYWGPGALDPALYSKPSQRSLCTYDWRVAPTAPLEKGHTQQRTHWSQKIKALCELAICNWKALYPGKLFSLSVSLCCTIKWGHTTRVRTQSCQLLTIPWPAQPPLQAPSSLGLLTRTHGVGSPISSSKDLPDPGIALMSLGSPALVNPGSLPLAPLEARNGISIYHRIVC